MSIQNTDFFHAAAVVTVAGGTPTLTSQRGFSAVADTGPGVVTLTMDPPIDPTARVVSVTPTSGATFATATVENTDDSTIVVRTFDAAGAALDNVSFGITVLRFVQ